MSIVRQIVHAGDAQILGRKRNNTITFDPSGGGMLQFWGIVASSLTNATISDNTVGPDSTSGVSGTNLTLFNNRHPDGTPVPGL